MAHPRIRAAALAAVALVASACTSTLTGQGSTARSDPAPSSSPAQSGPSPSGASTAPTQPPAKFADCSADFNLDAIAFPAGRRDRLSFDCAKIAVPLDYADPTGKKISLQIIKVHDSAQTNRIGSLLVNPGGPGGGGITFAVGLATEVPDTLLEHFDLIGFDPRGVGESSPISCLSDHDKDVLNAESPDVQTAAGFAEAKRVAKQVATACSDKYGSALAQFDTVQTAKDMDQIRQAVGDPKMNYLGFSYGTELGAQYLHLFPKTVRVAVLDGAVDPLTDDITSFADQLQGFEDAFDQFAAYCRRTSPCSDLGDPRTAVYKVVDEARAAPIPSSAPGETRKATSAIVYTGVLSALYSQSQWARLGQALTDAGNGDSSGLFQLADNYNERSNGHYTNISDANTTINCNDSKPGPSDPTIRATTASWVKRFPMFGLWSAPALFSCQQWQPHRTVLPLPTARTTAEPVLVVGNLHDPATPYQGSKDLTKTLGHAELLSWDGEGHTSYLQGSDCIDKYVDDYLVAGTLPAAEHDLPSMNSPTLDVDPPAGAAQAIALVLHGGRADGFGPVRRRQLAVVRMTPFARSLRRAGRSRGLGVARLRYSVRGWNQADQSPVRDVRWALEQLADQFPGVPVALIGHSMGGRAAVYAAGHESVRAVVGLAPWFERGDPFERLAGRRVLILHGDRDRITSPGRSAALAEEARTVAASVTYVRIAGDRHAMLRRANLWHSLTTGFVLDVMCDVPPGETVDAPAANVLAKVLAGEASLVV